MPRKKTKEVPEQKEESSGTTEQVTEAQDVPEPVSEEKVEEISEKTASEKEVKEKPAEKPSGKEEQEKVLEERVYTFRLGRIYSTTRKKRAPRAVKYIKSRLERHLKKPVKISPEVNSIIWFRGAEKPVRKITVKTLIYEDRVLVVPMR